MKVFIASAVIILLCFSALWGAELTADQITRNVNDIMNQESVYGRIKMTIVTSSGRKREFEYDSWSKGGGEKTLIRYTAPARVKGQAMLMLNNADDIWAYFPRTKRVRKLATHAKKQKMQGSDFTYEDMGSGDSFIKDFNAKRLKDEKAENHDCFKIELGRKKDSGSHYSRMIMWVIKENFVPAVIDYYDEDDMELCLKRLVQYNIKDIDGVPTAMKMIMYDKTDNTQTEMEILSCRYNIQIEDNVFTERNLSE